MRFSLGATIIASSLLISAHMTPSLAHDWITLIDGEKGLENFNTIGDANWRAEDGAIIADSGAGGHLVTKDVYQDVEIHAEFWADHTTNSGIFLRAQDPLQIGFANSYEVNIFDQRPGQEYSTGAIVGFAAVHPPYPRETLRNPQQAGPDETIAPYSLTCQVSDVPADLRGPRTRSETQADAA